MVHFRYMGEMAKGPGFQSGPCLQIKIPTQNGDKIVLTATDQVAGFVIGEDVGFDFTDNRSLRFLRADPRFQEIK